MTNPSSLSTNELVAELRGWLPGPSNSEVHAFLAEVARRASDRRPDRDGGGSRGRLPAEWNPACHATYCPQHSEPPVDGGGSSWLCCCSGPLYELRAAARAVIDAEYGSNMWVEAFDVLVDVVLEQERLGVAAEDRAGEVAFRGEEHVARLEAEASRG